MLAGIAILVVIGILVYVYQMWLKKGLRTRVVHTFLPAEQVRGICADRVTGLGWQIVDQGNPLVARASLLSGIRQEISCHIEHSPDGEGLVVSVYPSRIVRKVLTRAYTKAHTLRIRLDRVVNGLLAADSRAQVIDPLGDRQLRVVPATASAAVSPATSLPAQARPAAQAPVAVTSGSCPHCRAPVAGAGRFCVRCGAPLAAVPAIAPAAPAPLPQAEAAAPAPRHMGTSTALPHQIGGAPIIERPEPLTPGTWPSQLPAGMPAIVAILALFVGALAVLTAWPNAHPFWTALRYLTQAHYGNAGSRLAIVGSCIEVGMPVFVAAGLFACATGIFRAVPTGRGVAIALSATVAFGELVNSHRTGWQTLALVLAIAVAVGLAALPDARRFFASDGRPAGPQVAAILIAFLAWAYVGIGLSAFAVSRFGGLPTGQYRAFLIFELCGGLVLLATTRAVRREHHMGSGIATALLASLGLSMALGQHWAAPRLEFLPLGELFLIAASVGAAVAIWVRTGGILDSAAAQALVTAGLPRASLVGLVGGGVVLVALAGLSLSPNHSSGSDFSLAVPTETTSAMPSDTSSSAQHEPSSTPTLPPVDAAGFTRSWDFTMTAVGGYAVAGAISVGAPVHSTLGLRNGDDTAGSACDIDQQTDALVPFTVRLTNSTSRFNTNMAVTVGLDQQSDDALSIDAEMHYTAGSVCSDQRSSNTIGLATLQPAVSGSAVVANGFIVVHGFYTPDSPNGNQSTLADTTLQLAPSQSWSSDDGTQDSVRFTVSDVTGPGVDGPGYVGWVLPLGDPVGA